MTNTKRAQAWGFDLIAGTMIFLAGMMLFYFYTINYSGGEGEILNVLHQEGELISDTLLSEGSPFNWDSSNVAKIGLLSGNKINETKWNYFKSLNYNSTRVLFRIRNEYYVYFDEDESNGIGLLPINPKNLVKTTRVVVYQNNITTMKVYSWN